MLRLVLSPQDLGSVVDPPWPRFDLKLTWMKYLRLLVNMLQTNCCI